jgi:hypothetical protein
VGSVDSRLRRLEESGRGNCPECYQKPKLLLAYYPQHGEGEPRVPTCLTCGRPTADVLRVVYEGEGGY